MDGAGGPPAPAAPGFRARVVLSLFVTLLVLGMVVASWVVDRQLQGPIRAWAQTVAENLASRAVAVAVRDRVAPSLAGTPLSQPLYDGSGRLQGITYATGAITRIASEAVLHIHDQLEAAAAAQLPVPLGQILGLDFLAAAGTPGGRPGGARRLSGGDAPGHLPGRGDQPDPPPDPPGGDGPRPGGHPLLRAPGDGGQPRSRWWSSWWWARCPCVYMDWTAIPAPCPTGGFGGTTRPTVERARPVQGEAASQSPGRG